MYGGQVELPSGGNPGSHACPICKRTFAQGEFMNVLGELPVVNTNSGTVKNPQGSATITTVGQRSQTQTRREGDPVPHAYGRRLAVSGPPMAAPSLVFDVMSEAPSAISLHHRGDRKHLLESAVRLRRALTALRRILMGWRTTRP